MNSNIIQKCPWQIQEIFISKFIHNNSDENFKKIFYSMNENSNHSEFWTEIYNTIIEYKQLKNKYEHLSNEFAKLEDEYENIYSNIYNH